MRSSTIALLIVLLLAWPPQAQVTVPAPATVMPAAYLLLIVPAITWALTAVFTRIPTMSTTPAPTFQLPPTATVAPLLCATVAIFLIVISLPCRLVGMILIATLMASGAR